MTAFVQTICQSCSWCYLRGLVTAIVPHGVAQVKQLISLISQEKGSSNRCIDNKGKHKTTKSSRAGEKHRALSIKGAGCVFFNAYY